MRQHISTVVLAFGLLAGCQYGAVDEESATTPVHATPVAEKPIMSDPKTFTEADQKACIDFGGAYTRAGLLGYYHCFVDYADGGKTCSDLGDCEGRCMATELDNFDPNAPGGQTGTCQKTDSPFGCNSEIVGGVVQPGLCVD